MSERASTVCIIPARGGSKRIPRKNIRPFRGRPMLDWPLEAARASGLFDIVMVSTDDEEIAAHAMSAGADVPFLRSAETSGDHATTSAVLTEVLQRFCEQGRVFERACCLYPTAAFTTPDDLREGLGLLFAGPFDAVMPVAEFPAPIQRSFARDASGGLSMNFPEHRDTRSQDLAPAFHDAGQWYWFDVEPFLKSGAVLSGAVGSVVLPAVRVQDIDTEDDWALAELKHERLFGAAPERE